VIDPGLARERTALSRRRTAVPFLVVALLGARAALDVPAPGLLLTAVAVAGATAVRRLRPSPLTAVVVLLAAVALALPAT
jgi:hypothetical protein